MMGFFRAVACIFIGLSAGIAFADCDCDLACSTSTFQDLGQTLTCNEADAIRCGGTLNLTMVSMMPSSQNSQADQFARALDEHREDVLTLYKNRINSRDYSRLAVLAFGIMGVESRYAQSNWYFLKRWTPDAAITAAKCLQKIIPEPSIKGLKNIDTSACDHLPGVSHGPTQMKEIPRPIQEHFGVTVSSLYRNPSHAAVATMGFLIEMKSALFDLKKKYPVQLAEMNEENYIDYLVYFYQGKGRRILKGEKPDIKKNRYLESLKIHLNAMQVHQMHCPRQKSAQSGTPGVK